MADASQKYRIIEKLGAGGMAEVYRGEMESLEGFRKAVAIKRILPSLTKNAKFVTMFLDEARLSLRLSHTNVVQVFDLGQAGSTYFLVMEYVDGVNLRHMTDVLRRRRRRIPTEVAIFIGIELCKGLGYAHDLLDPDTNKPLGIVHRDVSPPNVLLSKMGEVKIVDFGLAKAAVQVGDTEPGVVKGKFSYLSPEAAMGQDVDHRSDVFSGGTLMFEMLTGKRLFYGETDWQTVELVRQGHVPSMSALNADIPEELDRIVRRALARDPEERYPHAADFADALAHHLFARGLKVTNRDLAQLVQECLAETMRPRPGASGLAQKIVEDEIRAFSSLDAETGQHAKVVDAAEGFKVQTGDLIDTSRWADEIGEPTPTLPKAATGGRAQPSAKGAPASAPPAKGQAPAPPRVPPPTPPRDAKRTEAGPKEGGGGATADAKRAAAPTSPPTTPQPSSPQGLPKWLIALVLVTAATVAVVAAMALKIF